MTRCYGPGRCKGIVSPGSAPAKLRVARVWEGTDGSPVLFASGYLTEGKDAWTKWRGLISNRFPRSPVYRVEWDCGDYRKLLRRSGLLGQTSSMLAPLVLVPTLPVIAAAWIPPVMAYNMKKWRDARAKAREAGVALADCLEGHECLPALLGHSLGGALMVSTARSVDGRFSGLDSIHLLGAAIPAGEDLAMATSSVDGWTYNYFSRADLVLRTLFRGGETGQSAIGCVGSCQPAVQDIDVTPAVNWDHGAYVGNILLR